MSDVVILNKKNRVAEAVNESERHWIDWIDLFVLSWHSSGYFVFILLVIVLSIIL